MDSSGNSSVVHTRTVVVFEPDVEAPEAPTNIPNTNQKEDPPCPPPNAQRIGDVAQSGTEKVSGFELQPDPNNKDLKICVTLYEELTVVEQYLPTAATVTTTAGIAVAATTSALLANCLLYTSDAADE